MSKDTHTLKGVAVMKVYHDRPPWYCACPAINSGTGKPCNKKTTEQGNQQWCCAAGHYVQQPEMRYILNFTVSDYSGALTMLTAFDEVAVTMLGKSANEMHALEQQKSPEYEEVYNRLQGQWFNFKIKSKMDTYQDKENVRRTAVAGERVDFSASGHDTVQEVMTSLA
jgi:replication factor A1